jgi:peptidoglycan/xylan/chitin deacetylase (PgdA/CDA1 family)
MFQTNYLMKALLLKIGQSLSVNHNQEPALTIVMYHRVGSKTPSLLDVSTEAFEEQLKYLQDHFEVGSMDEAVAELAGGLKRSFAVLTFDDCYFDFYMKAFPILQRRGLPSTIYLPTQFCDEGKFPWDARYSTRQDIRCMTWSELTELHNTDSVEIGSHTHSHPRLDRIGREQTEAEIKLSADLISANLGERPRHFSCPYGIPSPYKNLIGNHFETIVEVGWLTNGPSADKLSLKRVPALPTSNMKVFGASLAGAGLYIEKMKHFLPADAVG